MGLLVCEASKKRRTSPRPQLVSSKPARIIIIPGGGKTRAFETKIAHALGIQSHAPQPDTARHTFMFQAEV